MTGSTKRVLMLAVPALVVVGAFWFLLIAPKRSESGDLSDEAASLRASIQVSEATIASAEAARKNFPKTYAKLVTYGKAVPTDSDQSTFIYDMADLSAANEVQFRDFQLTPSGAAPAPAPVEPTTPAGAAEQSEQEVDAATGEPGATPAAATEASAATLPIGATIGPAGLGVMPYEFKFRGDFFRLADFFGDLDGSIDTKGPENRSLGAVNGRLVTIDGFTLGPDATKGFPRVEADFAVTTYVVPAEVGLTVGATPTGPAPVAGASPAPVSTEATAP